MIADLSVLGRRMFLLVFGVVIVGWSPSAAATALDDYVAAPEPNYGYTLENTIPGSGYTGYVLDMKSQNWRDEPNEVDRSLWQHWVIIVVPDTASSDKAMLVIDGGSNGEGPPGSVDDVSRTVALMTNTVVALVQMVPNQPLTFADESEPRSEDALIAYTWDKFLTTGDPTWPAQLPMTKSVVRAMDTVQSFLADPNTVASPVVINEFLVGGGSKRGWATWLTAAVDSRVVAIAPLVIDLLNMEVSFAHQFNSYGFWAPANSDYEDMGIMDRLGTPEMGALMGIIDPYEYRDRFTMPKYVLNATGDEHFHPESSRFYFDDLPGVKHLRYVPNMGHDGSGFEFELGFALLDYYQTILDGTPLPQFSWTLENDGSIRVQTDPNGPPDAVKVWQVTNPTNRDFRLETLGPAWTSTALVDQGGGVYIGQVPEPPTGFTAFLVELQYGSGSYPPKYTTHVRVIPEPATLNLRIINEAWGSVEVEPNLPSYYDPNTTVTLTAYPLSGKALKDWTIFDPNYPGDANYATVDTNSVLQLAMTHDWEVQARFKCGSSETLPPIGMVLLVLGLAIRRRFLQPPDGWCCTLL